MSLYRLWNPKTSALVLRNAEFRNVIRRVTLKATPYQASPEIDHDEKNMKLGRPQSPHLTIYAPQLTSMLSISHRMTGALLAGYAFLLGGGALVLPDQISHYMDALHVGSGTLVTMKFLIAFPFSYHFCNGLRHLVWDMGVYLTNKGVITTGYIMLGASSAVALGLSVM